MLLNVTLSAESISELKAVLTPPSAPLFDPKSPFGVDAACIAEEVMENHGPALVDGIVDQCGDDLAAKIGDQIGASEIASYIDMGDLAREMANEIDHDEVARLASKEVDLSDLAREMADEIDMDDVVGRIDMDDLAARAADNLSTSDLVHHLNHKQIALQLVTQFVNNKEFRDCFVDSIVERLSGIKV
jgi:hypothetical protein